MTYRTEFPGFAEADLPAVPASWRDLSWHNDACPFFLATDSLGVWIDYANPDHSDFGREREARFMVVPMENGEHPDHAEALLVTDEWPAVLAFVEARA